MAAEKIIVGVFYSPADENGERKRIIIQTNIDNIIDEETGKTLTQLIKENTYTDATEQSSGLMSAQSVKNLKQLMGEAVVISEVDPKKPCMWYKIEGSETV